MLLYEKEISIPTFNGHKHLLNYLSKAILERLSPNEMPVRFVVTESNSNEYKCEVGVLRDTDLFITNRKIDSIFKFKKREYESFDKFNVVLLVPTGIGAELGGHSGDAGPVARLLASACDNLITHPNVVNASDINELPENGLYVEGSIITRMLMGTIGLQKVPSNRVILIIDNHPDKFFNEAVVNSVSAARAALGLSCPKVIMIEENVLMKALFSSSGRAVGIIERFEHLCEVLEKHRSEYDAIALSTMINVPSNYHEDYFKDADMVNPWGGVEAMLTHSISTLFDIPSAHSPMMESKDILDLDLGVVDPRKAAELVSVTYLHCVLKGLHRSPRIITDRQLLKQSGALTASDVSCLVIPYGCLGLPTLAALEQGIPVIMVKENRNTMKNNLEELPFASGKLIVVENYLEAAGVMNALRSGVSLESVRRPIAYTELKRVSSRGELSSLVSFEKQDPA